MPSSAEAKESFTIYEEPIKYIRSQKHEVLLFRKKRAGGRKQKSVIYFTSKLQRKSDSCWMIPEDPRLLEKREDDRAPRRSEIITFKQIKKVAHTTHFQIPSIYKMERGSVIGGL